LCGRFSTSFLFALALQATRQQRVHEGWTRGATMASRFFGGDSSSESSSEDESEDEQQVRARAA